ncbi:hypothetical protein pb186bvf_019404 [Paramecium bursaria]
MNYKFYNPLNIITSLIERNLENQYQIEYRDIEQQVFISNQHVQIRIVQLQDWIIINIYQDGHQDQLRLDTKNYLKPYYSNTYYIPIQDASQYILKKRQQTFEQIIKYRIMGRQNIKFLDNFKASITQIVKYLKVQDFLKLNLVCSQFYHILSDNNLWNLIYIQSYGYHSFDINSMDWRKVYINKEKQKKKQQIVKKIN